MLKYLKFELKKIGKYSIGLKRKSLISTLNIFKEKLDNILFMKAN